ncbi:MAG TPA: hypothetical protein VKX46_12155 [Ktedonobacteraceae bacterium]|nr:hypothetical protein [Ktedonobacteraceae bacterium]
MSFQVYIKADKSLQQLAAEIRDLLSLPPFKLDTFADAPYCQFETLGMLVLLRQTEEEESDPEVRDFPYTISLQLSFTEHELDIDDTEYQLQPYYAQLLAFHMGIETACYEKKRVGQHWQIRYRYYFRNPTWNESILYGEPGWAPAVLTAQPSAWRTPFPKHNIE